MGSPRGEAGRDDNEAPHRVRITRPFLLKATEVTQGEWRALMGTSPAHFAACGDACPIEWVNWYEAAAYCNARSRSEALPECYELEGCFHEPGEDMECQAVRFAGLDCPGYRLPTEAEWEHAARAGTTGAVYDEEEPWRIVGVHHAPALDPIAWYGGNSGTDFPGAVDCSNLAEPHHPADRCGPHPVAQKRPNPWGLYDMLGNIWEWTWDRYAADYGGFGEPDRPVLDPLGPGNGAQRVVRGGSWGHDAAGVRAAARAGFGQTAGCLGAMVGFRPARSLPEPGAGD